MILVKKLKFFHLLYLSKIDGEKVFADVLDKKEAFKEYKNNCLRYFAGSLDRWIGRSMDLLIAGSVGRWICNSWIGRSMDP